MVPNMPLITVWVFVAVGLALMSSRLQKPEKTVLRFKKPIQLLAVAHALLSFAIAYRHLLLWFYSYSIREKEESAFPYLVSFLMWVGLFLVVGVTSVGIVIEFQWTAAQARIRETEKV